ncbi:hypothetical protein C8R47DRAFT_1225935 [Mycena vitilis]|nr:hypothetical protein C8R47DRAFT_1225935 [Mycena vitilis]
MPAPPSFTRSAYRYTSSSPAPPCGPCPILRAGEDIWPAPSPLGRLIVSDDELNDSRLLRGWNGGCERSFLFAPNQETYSFVHMQVSEPKLLLDSICTIYSRRTSSFPALSKEASKPSVRSPDPPVAQIVHGAEATRVVGSGGLDATWEIPVVRTVALVPLQPFGDEIGDPEGTESCSGRAVARDIRCGASSLVVKGYGNCTAAARDVYAVAQEDGGQRPLKRGSEGKSRGLPQLVPTSQLPSSSPSSPYPKLLTLLHAALERSRSLALILSLLVLTHAKALRALATLAVLRSSRSGMARG